MALQWNDILYCCLMTSILLVSQTYAACVWPQEWKELQIRCVCGSGGNSRLSVQCGSVELSEIVAALQSQPPLDLLSVSNSSTKSVEDAAFKGLNVQSVEVSSSGLKSISLLAFEGLELTLTSLNLQQNELKVIPSAALRRLRNLKELDLSHNHITSIGDGAFRSLPLTTLRLSDNMLQFSDVAFRGLESSLRNLYLKSTGQTSIPQAIQQLSELSFLDMAQNGLKELPANGFAALRRLTALTLERNMINIVDKNAFIGLNESLSSLSLLNNKLEEFPGPAIRSLSQLRVLDLGFNRIRSIPKDAFRGNTLLALLALDGNPLPTLSDESFSHLNSTLRGLSVGGSSLVCDCHLKWILEWIKTFDLQVTSRERNPQFCGKPQNLQRRLLPQLQINELRCPTDASTPPQIVQSTTSQPLDRTSTSTEIILRASPEVSTGRDMRGARTVDAQLRLVDVSRQGTEVIVRWEEIGQADRSSLPVHAVYRVFGEPQFHVGASVSRTVGWTQVTVPQDEAIIVCVVESSQSVSLSPDLIPYSQCHELKMITSSQINKVIIGASAAVCGMIIIAVLIFVCCSRRPPRREAAARPSVKSEHEWETSSVYSTRSIPRARTYHGTANQSYQQESQLASDGQSCRSFPSSRVPRGPVLTNRDLHNSRISLSQLSGHHSFLGTGSELPHSYNTGRHEQWDNGDLYTERQIPSRLSYTKDNSFRYCAQGQFKDNSVITGVCKRSLT